MKAQCLCGAVTVTTTETSAVDACHCGMCRRWGGGPFLSIHCGTDVAFEGKEKIIRYPSSDWAERAFCSVCGTHLYYKLKATGEHFVSAGLFPDMAHARLQTQIFIDKKPGYYSFANTTENLTEAEVFAKYAPP